MREARNAVALARLAGADRHASDTFRKTSESLDQAEAYQRRDAGNKPVIMVARAAAQMAEDARLIAIERQIEQQTAAANDAAAERELQMLANARAESERARKADAERAAAEEARARAEETAGRLTQEKAAAEQAEQDKAALRARLREQLNIILETRESARGLIVNMSDVLFDSDRATLRPRAREAREGRRRPARVSGLDSRSGRSYRQQGRLGLPH